MTKVGEGKIPEEPTEATYRAALNQNVAKFQNALESYQESTDANEKMRLKEIMNQQLGLIKSSIQEIKRSGIYNQDVKVETDYQKFIANPSAENTAALEHDLQTLKEYNQLGS